MTNNEMQEKMRQEITHKISNIIDEFEKNNNLKIGDLEYSFQRFQSKSDGAIIRCIMHTSEIK